MVAKFVILKKILRKTVAVLAYFEDVMRPVSYSSPNPYFPTLFHRSCYEVVAVLNGQQLIP